MKTNCWLNKTCATGHAARLCDKVVATAMLGFAIQLKDIEMADYWKDKMLNG